MSPETSPGDADREPAKGWYADTIRRVGHARWFAAVSRRLAPPVDRVLYRLSGGRVLSTGKPVLPTMLLTTVGRKTGKQRTTPVLYVRDGDRLLVAGTNFGQPRSPAWALNLQANPRARAQLGRSRGRFVARRASPGEREALWPKLERIWPAYATYRDRSGRDVDVFVLEPVPES